MAQLIPDFIHSDAPPGEKQIFSTLRNSRRINDWVVLHSFNLPHHQKQIAGEIDFLILVPGKGILILEVKSHQTVRRQRGLWYLGNDPPAQRGPFEQASMAMYTLKADLSKNLTTGNNRNLVIGVPFTYAVAFTNVRFDEEANEWEPWQVIDRRSMDSQDLQDAIENVLDKNRQKLVEMKDNPEQRDAVGWFDPLAGQPSEARVHEIAKHLRGNFEIHMHPQDLDRDRRAEYKKFMEEQFDALDTMSKNQRTLFDGPAGTGKTLLAVETARRAINQNARTLLLCFNRMLANFLILEVRDKDGFTGTIDRFVSKLPGQIHAQRLQETLFFENAWINLQRSHAFENYFDCIIVDEIQDICSIGAVKLVAELVRRNPSAEVRFFGDFNNQNIQGRGDRSRNALLEEIPDLVTATLTKNCRNRPGIGAVVHLATGLQNLYKGYRLEETPDNFELEVTSYPVQQATFEKVIDDVFKRFVPNSVAILSGDKTIPVKRLGERHENSFTDDIKLWRPNGFQGISTTIRKFKGLDAQAVILTDLPDDLDVSLMYTGISRAIERLIILCPKPMVDKIYRRMPTQKPL